VICPLILPSCLDFLFPPHVPRHHIPPISAHVVVVPPSLTMPSTLIVVRVSCSHSKCTPCHLTSSLLPCLLAFKNRRPSKMILRIVAPLVASVGTDATLKQDLCVSSTAPSFSMACRRCNLSPGRNRISIAYGSDGKLDLSGVSQRKKEWILILAYCQTIPPPPPKIECLQCTSVTLLRLAGRWRGDTEEERGRNGDEVHGTDAIFVVGFGRKY
jgi:hypothetical protein